MDYELLKEQVNLNKSINDLSKYFGKGKTTIRHWLKKYGLSTTMEARRAGPKPKLPVEEDRKYCAKCATLKPLSTFGNRKRGGFRGYCKSCESIMIKQRELKTRQIVQKTLGFACSYCGYSTHWCGLSIHHLDPSKKDKNFSSFRTWSKSRLLNELKDCILLCKNCHRKIHYEMDDNKLTQSGLFRRNTKRQAIAYKGDQCSNCGDSSCESIFDFHHTNPNEKEFTPLEVLARSLRRLKMR